MKRCVVLVAVFLLSLQSLVFGQSAGTRTTCGTPISFANLSAEPNSTTHWVPDGTAGSSPCTGGGSGACATRIGGAWSCGGGGGGGGGGGSGSISVTTYGALCNNSHDDAAAFQAAINAACALELPEIAPTVTIPFGNCVLSKPIIETCNKYSVAANAMNLTGASYLSTLLVPTSLGPVILAVASNQISQLNGGVITGAPLCTGCGPSIVWTGSGQSDQFGLDLSEDLTSLNTNTTTPNPYVNGASALDIRGFFVPTATGTFSAINCSQGTVDYGIPRTASPTGIMGGAFCVWQETDNKLHGFITTSVNGLQIVQSTGTVTQSITNEYELQFDSANGHIGIALNGTFGTLVAATGTIVQRSDEMTSLGYINEGWPHSQLGGWWHGSLGDPEIATIARHPGFSNYTQDTAAFTFDAHTMYGSTFAQQMDMPNTTQPILFGADYFNGAAVTNVWASVHVSGLGCCGGTYNVSNLSIYGGGIGIDDANAIINVEHVQLQNQTVMGIITSPSGTFGSRAYDIRGGGDRMGMVVFEGGISWLDNIYTGACGLLCDFTAGGSFTNSYIAGQSDTSWPLVITGPMKVDNVNEDSENGGACPGGIIEGGNGQSLGPSSVRNSQIATCGGTTASPIVEEGMGQGVGETFANDSLAWAGATPAIVHQIGATQFGLISNVFDNDSFPVPPFTSPGATPYVDGSNYQVLGSSVLTPITLTGTTAGTAVFSEPVQSGNYKVSVVNLAGYENTTAAATDISVSSVDNSFNTLGAINFTAGNGFTTGQGVTVTGNGTSANNGTFTVVSSTATKLIVSGATLTTEAAGSTVSFAQAYIYPLPYTVTPSVLTLTSSCSGVTTTKLAMTVPTSMGGVQTGTCSVGAP